MLGTGILFSSPLTGVWKIDENYTYEHNKGKFRDVIFMTLKIFSELAITDDNKIVATKVGLPAKLKKKDNHYVLVSEGKESPLHLVDARHMKLIIMAADNTKYTLYYSRIKSKNEKTKVFTSSEVGFELNHVYRTEKIDNEYRFMLFTDEGTLYYVQTDRAKHLTESEMRSKDIMKILKQKSSMGSSFTHKDSYTLKSGKVHTLVGDQNVKVINAKKLKYYGIIYVLHK